MSTSNPTQTIVTNPVDTGNEEYYLWERLTGLLDFGVQSYLIEFEDVNSFFETFNSLQSAEEKNKYIDGLDEAINVKSKIRQAANDINSIEIFRKKVKEIGSQLDDNVRMFFEYLAYTYIGGGEIDAQAKEIIENALAAGAQGTNIEVLQQKVYDIKRDPFRVDQIQRGGAISKGEIQSLLDTLDNDESDVSGRSAESFGVQQPSQPPAQGQVRAPQSGQARPPQNNLPPQTQQPPRTPQQQATPQPQRQQPPQPAPHNAFGIPSQRRAAPTQQPPQRPAGPQPVKQFNFNQPNPGQVQQPPQQRPQPQPAKPQRQRPQRGANTQSIFDQPTIQKKNAGLDDLLK
jgi:hypothetical protein